MRTLKFCGYNWLLTDSENKRVGLQDSFYSPKNVWIDDNGYLHLKVTRQDEYKWQGARVSLEQTLGYGTYNFFLVGRVDTIEKVFIASCSLDKDEASKIAIHFSQWTPARNQVYPYNIEYSARKGNEAESHPTRIELNGTYTTHRIIWKPNSLSFLSLHGHYETVPPSPDFIIKEFTYQDCPVSDTERVTISVSKKKEWRLATTQGTELIVANFSFHPG